MRKFLICALLAAALLSLAPAESEARCGRGGIFRGRIRGWISSHRPHILHRGGCR